MRGNGALAFILKTVNLLLICAALAVYQNYADQRALAVEEHQQQEAEAAAAWQQAEEDGTEETGQYQDGIYEGTGKGFGGEIRVQVTLSGGMISFCEVVSAEKETPEYLASAEAVLEEVVEAQSAEVDTVSGATLSSNGLLEGVREALEQAEENT